VHPAALLGRRPRPEPKYDRPDLAEGPIIVARWSRSPLSAGLLQLKALDPEAKFGVLSDDDHFARRLLGKTLLTPRASAL
jgi:hypothetical protein